MVLNSLIGWLGLAGLFLLLVSVYRRREGIRHGLRRLVIVGLTYIGVTAYLVELKWPPWQAVLLGVFAAFVVDAFIPRRSRYIRRSVRKKAINTFESETGEKFNPRIHELDHMIPFSRGGSSTPDNLQVKRRQENRAKGAKSPWWDFLGR